MASGITGDGAWWFAILLVVGGLTAVYLWLVQRWWLHGPWVALVFVDAGLFALAVLLLLSGSNLLSRAIGVVFLALSVLAATLHLVLARRVRGTTWEPVHVSGND